MNKDTQAYKIAKLSMFAAFAILLSYVEVLIPFNIGIPGVKLGLANLVIIILLYDMGVRECALVNVVRILVIGFLYTNLFSIWFSVMGAAVSLIVMWLFKKMNFHMIVISVVGGISHNAGQLVIAMFVVNTYSPVVYAPILLVSGFITGLLIGLVADLVRKRIKDVSIYKR